MAQMKRGQGTVFQDKKTGKWIWQGSYIGRDGKKKRPKKTFNLKEQALLFQAEQLKEQEVKKMKMTKPITLEEAFNEFYQEWLDGRGKRYSINTMRCTKSNFQSHIIPEFGKMSLLKITQEKVERFYWRLEDDELSNKTILNIHCDFKKLFKYAMKKKYIYYNCLEEIKIENCIDNVVVNVLEDWEFQEVLKNKKNQEYYYYPVIKFLGETGLRAEELAFQHSDIVFMRDDVNRKVRIYKSVVRDTDNAVKKKKTGEGKLVIVPTTKGTSSYRDVPLSLEAEGALMNWLDTLEVRNIVGKDGVVFCSTTGNYIDKDSILRSFHQMLENCGLRQRGLHSLRKRFINHAIRNEVRPDDLAKITGHSLNTMFKYYKQLEDKDLKRIVEMI